MHDKGFLCKYSNYIFGHNWKFWFMHRSLVFLNPVTYLKDKHIHNHVISLGRLTTVLNNKFENMTLSAKLSHIHTFRYFKKYYHWKNYVLLCKLTLGKIMHRCQLNILCTDTYLYSNYVVNEVCLEVPSIKRLHNNRAWN